MLLFWILLVLGLASSVIVLCLHAKAVALLWIVLANTYLTWYGQQTYRGSIFYYVGWMRDTLVSCNSLSHAYISIWDSLYHKVSSLPSTLLFVAPRLGWLGQLFVNWIAKRQYFIIVRVSSRSQDTICNFHFQIPSWHNLKYTQSPPQYICSLQWEL